MTPELTVLALCGLLQALQFLLFAIPANIELGTGYTSSARDRPPSRQLSIRTARLQRALNNHFEALILFTLAVVTITLSGQSSPLTQTAAWIFLAARILYIPAYALGWRPWRSAIWAIGFLATLTLLVAALL
ncbi:MAPEG family protein [Xinfangfangia sp. CPCC 101601]|uniref:MAPEG family protein n=1 Tax=Pseudogemmobacter lacusdianii TaxID=3069608 RepID=A0ABU0VWM1_9RHOB|nr:MAPEG family protein [Xinfangfangia sp. CPCC 101601]MDQ2066154.1 MAPEG family protein [Xinfangfangia sp. CPCC 101601]